MINEDTVTIGKSYLVIKQSLTWRGPLLVGRVGVAKWANYRGICLKFNDGSAYVLEFDCVSETQPNVKQKPSPFRTVPTSNNAKVGIYCYRLAKLPGDGFISMLGHIGSVCSIRWASDGVASVGFENGDSAVIPLSCLEDLRV